MKQKCTVLFAISMLMAAAVRADISYSSHTILSTSGGVISDAVEPGETFFIRVTTVNDGSARVTGISSMLLVNSNFTSVQRLSSPSYSLNSGSTFPGTYRVVCSPDAPDGLLPITLVNSAAGISWTNVFYIDVVLDADLSVDPITITVVPGAVGSGSLSVKNFGNAGTVFTVDADVPSLYTFDDHNAQLQSFWSAEVTPGTVFSWTSSVSESDEQSIGFPFHLFGTDYTGFSAGTDGTMTLMADDGSEATLVAYPLSTGAAQSSLRFRIEGGRLVVAWNNNSEGSAVGPEFQAWLNSDGTIQFLYANGDWDEGEVGMEDSQNSQLISYTPRSEGWTGLLMEPYAWITYETSGTVSAEYGDTANVLFTADASAWSSGSTFSNDFTATVSWGDQSVPAVVTVALEKEVYSLDVPSSVAFSGPAGSISLPAKLTVTNSGNVALSYTIRNSSARSAGYDWTEGLYKWRHIPDTLSTVVDFSETSAVEVPIGFPFVFYGTTYSNVTVLSSGRLTFDGGEAIVPFSAGLEIDSNADVRYVTDAGKTSFTVNWLNMNQSAGGDDHTFEAVLRPDGTISFNYQSLDTGWTDGTMLVSGAGSTSASLFNDSTSSELAVYTTNSMWVTNLVIGSFVDRELVETVTTNYVTVYDDTVSSQGLLFTPGEAVDIISYSPVSGTVPVDGTADITLRGDARDLSAGGANDVGFTSTLAFLSDGDTETATVVFTATGSADTAYPEMTALSAAKALVAANWGSDTPVVSVELNSDGSRTLSWDEPADSFNRLYTVYSSTNLAVGAWEFVGTVTNLTSYVDTNNAPVIFYKAEVGSVTE